MEVFKIKAQTVYTVLLFAALCNVSLATDNEEEAKAVEYLETLNARESEWMNKALIAEWAYASNLTEDNLKRKVEVGIEFAEFRKETKSAIEKYKWKGFKNEILKRQFKLHSEIGAYALPADKYERLEKITSEMQEVYSTAKICIDAEEQNCDNSLEPELVTLLTNSRDPELLKRVWINWRKAVGSNVRDLFREYVDLSNEAARLNDYPDDGKYWLRNYEDPEFTHKIRQLLEEVKPLYEQLHAYVRFKLREKYGDVVSEKGPIPMHLLGNMWAQSWANINDFTLPYPQKEQPDLTEELRKQNYTVEKIFQTSEAFFKSTNLTEMPQTFWERSVLEKPKDRKIICHASAWDFYDKEDFRIKQCTEISIEHFFVAHHEMGHVEYFLQYKDQPVKFREGANNGFHEAVGDLIALSVRSTKHLRKIGLLNVEDDNETILNNLFSTGLDRISFLPFAYVMDLWRWEVFNGEIEPNEYNCKWWDLIGKYQGVEPPIDRSEEDFDPGSKYHILADVPYIRYFVSFIVQFQFHKALCEIAGEYDPNDPAKPLHACDIYGNTDAGNALKKMLSLGSSRPWPDAMEVLTGQREMDASGLLEYFKPLQLWLESKNKKSGAYVGWLPPGKVCKRSDAVGEAVTSSKK